MKNEILTILSNMLKSIEGIFFSIKPSEKIIDERAETKDIDNKVREAKAEAKIERIKHRQEKRKDRWKKQ